MKRFLQLAILILAAEALAQQPFDKFASDTMTTWRYPGMAIAIVQNDRVVYAKGFGVKEIGKSDRVSADTLFQIGSTSKAFTTTAMAMLVDEKKVDWDDPVRKHLEYFHLADPCADALVTLRDLDSIESINTQLQVSERLAAVGRITAGVAHEVKNPLNSMRLWLENLKESLPADRDGGAQQAVQVLDKEIDRLDAVVKRFLDFTRPMELKLEATNLAELLRDVLSVSQPQLRKAGIEADELLGNGVPEVWADRDLLKQAVLNLVLNAVEAMPSGGELHVELARRGEMAEIRVSDTGKGIPLENQQKIFQLFFTTRPGGSGIGLATTFRIVQLHNGSIDFHSEIGRGTTFRIELPLAA